MRIRAVVLCGGSGSRLWPISRDNHPKPFVRFGGQASLLESTLRRVTEVDPSPALVCHVDHHLLAKDVLDMAGTEATLLLEPEAKGTAAAVALAALALGLSDSDLILVTPSDHHVSDPQAWRDTVNRAVAIALEGRVVLFGVPPGHASSDFGYISTHVARSDGAFEVLGFVEKPSLERAGELLARSEPSFWNSGMVISSAGSLRRLMSRHAPDLFRCVAHSIDASSTSPLPSGSGVFTPTKRVWSNIPSGSLDTLVLEKADNLCVLPLKCGWSDVGSWDRFTETNPQALAVSPSLTVLHETRRTLVYGSQRVIVAVGTQNLLIVDTIDALLVVDLAHADGVKQAVQALTALGHPSVTHPSVSHRPWGTATLLHQDQVCKIKRLVVSPGGTLSLQRHQHRAEHWVVLRGMALVEREGETAMVHANESVFIGTGQVHRLSNPGVGDLEVVEVQTGQTLSEDDIERLDDAYGRSDPNLRSVAR